MTASNSEAQERERATSETSSPDARADAARDANALRACARIVDRLSPEAPLFDGVRLTAYVRAIADRTERLAEQADARTIPETDAASEEPAVRERLARMLFAADEAVQSPGARLKWPYANEKRQARYRREADAIMREFEVTPKVVAGPSEDGAEGG